MELADVQTLINDQMNKQRQEHDAEMADLRQQLEDERARVAGGAPLNTVPFHAGGVGTSIADTWSMAQQTAEFAKGEKVE